MPNRYGRPIDTRANWLAVNPVIYYGEEVLARLEDGRLVGLIGDDPANTKRFADYTVYQVDYTGTAAAAEAAKSSETAAKASETASAASEVVAVVSAGTASSAAQAVKDALDNLPAGAVPVINDVTTGGAAAALSAEQGKVLAELTAEQWAAIHAQLSKKADKKPPQEFDFPFTAGIQRFAQAHYFKTQDSVGTLNLSFRKPDSSPIPSGTVIGTLPIGYRPTKNLEVPMVTLSGGIGKIDVLRNLGHDDDGIVKLIMISGTCDIAFVSSIVYETDSGPIAYGTPVRMAAARSARTAIPEEPIDKCFCVVDADGHYQTLVLVTITHDELGALYTPHCYDLKDGERFVDTQYPTIRPHAGTDGFILPRWDDVTLAWTEAATAEEITAWEAEHPAPTPPGPSQMETMQEKVKLLEARQRAVSDRQDFTEDCIAEMAGQVYNV